MPEQLSPHASAERQSGHLTQLQRLGNRRERQVSTDELREQLDAGCDVSETHYAENPESTTSDGRPWFTDTAVRAQRDSTYLAARLRSGGGE